MKRSAFATLLVLALLLLPGCDHIAKSFRPSKAERAQGAQTAQTVAVPDLHAMSVREVAVSLRRAHLKLGSVSVVAATGPAAAVPPGCVVSQEPAAATNVDEGATVNIVTSQLRLPSGVHELPESDNVKQLMQEALSHEANPSPGAVFSSGFNTISSLIIVSSDPATGLYTASTFVGSPGDWKFVGNWSATADKFTKEGYVEWASSVKADVPPSLIDGVFQSQVVSK